MLTKSLSLTVGITTCYGSESLLETVKSINRSRNVPPFRFIIVADTVRFKKSFLEELKKSGVEVIENRERSSQLTKQKQIAALSRSDITILTQDDVLFEENALADILQLFSKNPAVTFTSLRNMPLPAETWFESAINIGSEIVHRAAQAWNNGDNYLAVDGRCIAFRTPFLKSLKLADQVVASDTYLYLANKYAGGKYQYLADTAVVFRNPQSLSEHLRKSSRFQYVEAEMKHYFEHSESEFMIPRSALVKSMLSELARKPIASILYMLITLYTRLFTIPRRKALTTMWEADLSTKNISVGR